MANKSHAPLQVLEIARRNGGVIDQWLEKDGVYIVLMSDGRKYKEEVQPQISNSEPATIRAQVSEHSEHRTAPRRDK